MNPIDIINKYYQEENENCSNINSLSVNLKLHKKYCSLAINLK